MTNSVIMSADRTVTVVFELCSGPPGDDDQDGVSNCLALCPTTLAGLTVDVDGCPPIIPGDFNRDGDVDMEDFGHLQICLAGSAAPQTDPACQDTDLNTDSRVDRTDADTFLGCLSGSLVPAQQDCAQ